MLFAGHVVNGENDSVDRPYRMDYHKVGPPTEKHQAGLIRLLTPQFGEPTFVCVMTSIAMQDVTLAVLAGGEGRRMGMPKQHLHINDQPVLSYLHDRFSWPGPTLVVTAPGREHPPGSSNFDAQAVDEIPNEGPLRGVLTALKNARTRWVVTVTVDMPKLETDQLGWLVARLQARQDLKGLMLQRIINGNPQIEPFPLACSVDAIEIIADRLSQGKRSVHSLSTTAGFAVEPAPLGWPVDCWTNLNEPKDFQAFMQSIRD